jgi:hypothetical protein
MSILLQIIAVLRDVGPWLGPLLGGVSLAAGAVATWVTYFFYHRKTVHAAWIESYRLLYAEFWKDKDIAIVRNLIANDVAYAAVEPILEERLKTDSNQLSVEENEMIELIDRFCALLVRIKFFEGRGLSKTQQALWNETYRDYWIVHVKTRIALRKYMDRFWPGLQSLLRESNV